VVRATREGPVLASLAQQRLWFVDQLEGGGAAYQVRGAIRLHGQLDCAALRRSLDTLMARHEALRTTFAQVNGEVQQIVAEGSPFALEEEDLCKYGAAEREARIESHVAEESAHRFDLSTGPLI